MRVFIYVVPALPFASTGHSAKRRIRSARTEVERSESPRARSGRPVGNRATSTTGGTLSYPVRSDTLCLPQQLHSLQQASDSPFDCAPIVVRGSGIEQILQLCSSRFQQADALDVIDHNIANLQQTVENSARIKV